MIAALRQWFGKLLKSLEVPAPEAANRLRRIEVVERHLVLPIKIAAGVILYHSFSTSPWFGIALGSLEVAVETVQTISVTYAAVNVMVAVVLLLSRRLPFALVQWSVFAICLVDAAFLACVTVLTGGYDSVLYWLFVGLIVRNAASIPPAWSQLVQNLCVCLCYVMSGFLDIAVSQSAPVAYSEGPRSVLIADGDIKNPPQFVDRLRRGADPVSQFLWRQFPPQRRRQLNETNSPTEDRCTLLVEELNKVVRGTNLYSPDRFEEVNLRQRTRSLLQSQPFGERQSRLNRMLLEDAYPFDITRSQTPRIMVETESAAEPTTEPLLIRLCVLLLTAVCCYGVQVLLEKQRIAVEESRESGFREAQLRSAGRLAAEIAHQIKNPLAIINNAAFSLDNASKAGKPAPPKQIEIIQEEVDRADRIITQLMGYAQLAEGHVERLGVTEEIDGAIAQIFPPGANYPAIVHRDYAALLPPLLMLRSHLSGVLLNLLQNAREATEGRGTVRVTARSHEDSAVEIEIADDGPGIPPDQQERVFEAYYTTKGRGTGLGLAIVKHNVELYGGSIRLESALGKGARFIIVFPARTQQ